MLSALPLPVAKPQNTHNRPLSSKFPSSSRCSSNMPPPTYVPKESTFDEVILRLQKLSIPSHSHSPPRSSPSMSFHPPPNPNTLMGGQCTTTLQSPFGYSWPEYLKESHDDLPTIIDSFAPRTPSFDLSPTSSSASSDPDLTLSSISSMSRRSSIDTFSTSQSRVIRLFNLPPHVSSFLRDTFAQNRTIPIPASMWVLRDGPGPHEQESIWAIFQSHEEAYAALTILSGLSLSVDTALESDLEPFQKLRRFELRSPVVSASPTISLPPPSPSDHQHHQHRHQFLRMSTSVSNLQGYPQVMARPGPDSLARGDYVISTNPPNPRTSFRLGDWICGSPKCAAHNFGRNLACIGCGCPRPGNRTPSPHNQTLNFNIQSSRIPASPRFVTPLRPNTAGNSVPFVQSPNSPLQSPTSYSHFGQASPFSQTQPPSAPQSLSAAKSPSPVHHLLTPSGRAFAIGGKVQNISSDPLSPCVMYWPDNEPFPEQGQIRPSIAMGVPQPPILNTGNRGPIEHQPGDWICLKCNYLNWRRRKVCQTCYPYAEGNGDSISASVQAERIALLTSVLNQNQGRPAPSPVPATGILVDASRSHSLTPPQRRRLHVDVSPPQIQPPVHRSQSHLELGAQYANCQPIYQTSGPRQSSSPFPPPAGPSVNQDAYAPAPLLPSFLQDIVQSPTLSPSSTSPSSAELSIEDYGDHVLPPPSNRATGSSASNLAVGNIWKLDGDETKGLSGIALPRRQDLMGGGRKDCHEMLRRTSQPSIP